ncbi:cob(I)yrinic acid a,c-diamide adenosyltransferase [Marinomonas mediterranea]|jgi:cob(I)yrinic acid a,c-diamide adenosyltransferase (EC 2.5.1.17)|uniref:Corrinoid adenosyltransferase n=1 Tax=Marinomonas mediterranea (strain ATCC 700492 / JCM 21426 / NBRC 103028 / MMB-1) TaxID=717774 RepID=F2K2Y8_MARM1|nr:cob(I)yrinic acid a,c-diamide adenosyltransferase [Marinomonas mediterranea]ADZ92377.1 cob(I)alamin adenosyltransferase [Marinomonas mediterranea MMB-1]WCN14374.1 cob(I)yrinic acid a,c-diamide adenosyltransferase [Marinomonas mediterranea]WCN18426.1 cob(I)yrinic acid a,c-diamide adenosyltransferase [Marinomonas mediterranea MMB-1]
MPNKTEEEKRAIQEAKLLKKKAVVDERIAKATIERGVSILLTGNGKGKSSSAFGTMARALGHGRKCAVVQFIKGRTETGEQKFFGALPDVEFHVMGHGFTWETRNPELEQKAAEQAWELAKGLLANPEVDFVLLDEVTYMYKYGYLQVEDLLAALESRPKHQNVMMTGRTAPRALLDSVDTHSKIANERHAFASGVKAQEGIEW